MPLPSSGSISLSQINTELGRASGANISLDSAENGSYVAINSLSTVRPSSSNPASMSEWRGYNHGCTAVSISPASVTINQGQSTTLTASGSSSYSWNTGATSASITVSPSTTTTYTVTGTTTGCTATGATRTVTVIPTTTTTTTTACPPNGTLLGTECRGTEFWGVYANGSCGTYDAIIDPCSIDCGCEGQTCTTYFIRNRNPERPAFITYIDCVTNQPQEMPLDPGGEIQVCAVTGSVNTIEGDTEVNDYGPCG